MQTDTATRMQMQIDALTIEDYWYDDIKHVIGMKVRDITDIDVHW